MFILCKSILEIAEFNYTVLLNVLLFVRSKNQSVGSMPEMSHQIYWQNV